MSEHKFSIRDNTKRRRTEHSPVMVNCEICQISISKKNYSRHKKTQTHQNKVTSSQPSSSSSEFNAAQITRAVEISSPGFDINDGNYYSSSGSEDEMELDSKRNVEFSHSLENQQAPGTEDDDSDSISSDSSCTDERYSSDGNASSSEETSSIELATNFMSSRFRALPNMRRSEVDIDNTARQDAEILRGMVPNFDVSDVEWNKSVDGNYPYGTPQNAIMQALVNGDDNQFSRDQLEKILYALNMILDLQEEAIKKNIKFVLPKLDNLWKFQTRENNNIPIIEATEKKVEVTKKHKTTGVVTTEEKDTSLILPSEHLALASADPTKSKFMSILPDRTPDQSLGLQQGRKWKEHKSFQHSMITEAGKQYWIGDIAIIDENNLFLIKGFFTKNKNRLAEGYRVLKEVGGCLGFALDMIELPVATFNGVLNKLDNLNNCFTFDNAGCLSETHKEILTYVNPLKVNKKDINGNPIPNSYYKHKIYPVSLFTDDYSGNSSKQHNPFESWSMTCAAMPYSLRMKRENTFFIWTDSKKRGLTGLSVIPFIVDDLKKMETGKLMYSAEEDEIVLVTAPLTFILADNPAHSDICGILGLTTLFPCRKCYFRNNKKKKNEPYTVPLASLKKRYKRRTKAHYIAASINDKVIIPDAVEHPLSAKALSYRNLGSEMFLVLESYDPAQDTPVEILHTILLGVAKYLVKHLIQVTLAGKESKMDLLINALQQYTKCKSYNRSFSKELKHCGSFLGRDFKQLIQILPIILSENFTDPIEDSDIILINKSLSKLGYLCSLVFVRQVENNFSVYIEEMGKAIDELITEVYNFDVATGISTPYSCKPKMHLISHLRDDLERFGCALHYETEKGEQFNKFLREHIAHTNKKNPTRDLALKFGKQETFRHVINGGSWVSKEGKRVKFGVELERYISSLGDTFFKEMLGESREFTDNNYTGIKNIKNGVCGVFQYEVNSVVNAFVGEVIDVDENTGKTILQKYAVSLTGSKHICKKDVLIETLPVHNLTPRGALDIFTKDSNGDPIINVNKFGSVMLLKSYIL